MKVPLGRTVVSVTKACHWKDGVGKPCTNIVTSEYSLRYTVDELPVWLTNPAAVPGSKNTYTIVL